MSDSGDPIALAQALIRCPSVTPEDAGALGVLGTALDGLGLPVTACVSKTSTRRMSKTSTPESAMQDATSALPATPMSSPVGDGDNWSRDPFSGAVIDGMLHGRGAADMKSAIAAFVAAVDQLTKAHGNPDSWAEPGSISLLITGDEEGPAVNGTCKVLEWLAERGENLDACLVGEPTNPDALGDMIKIGRRGSTTGGLIVRGIQGHTAYPHLADNPIHHMVRMLNRADRGSTRRGHATFSAFNFATHHRRCGQSGQ